MGWITYDAYYATFRALLNKLRLGELLNFCPVRSTAQGQSRVGASRAFGKQACLLKADTATAFLPSSAVCFIMSFASRHEVSNSSSVYNRGTAVEQMTNLLIVDQSELVWVKSPVFMAKKKS